MSELIATTSEKKSGLTYSEEKSKLVQLRWIFFILLNILLIGSSLFEQLNVHDGLGWDGMTYAAMVKNYISLLTHKGLDAYYIQRVLPSGLVFLMIKTLGLGFTNHNIILVFSIYNIVLVNLSLYLWFRLMKQFDFSIQTQLVATVLLLGNFCILKFAMFYPVLTDISTFLLGMLLLQAYLNGRQALLLVLGLIGAFCHPLIQYFALLLFLFPRGKDKVPVATWKPMRFFPLALSAGYVCFILYLFVRRPDLIDAHLWQGTDPVDRQLLFLSMICSAAYLFYISLSVVRNRVAERSFENRNWMRIGLALVSVALVIVVRKFVSGPKPAFGFKDFRLNLVLQSISDPFEFLVSHFIFFGLAVFFIILFFRKFEKQSSELGTGFMLFIYAVLFLGVGSETRQYTFALPFLIFPLCFIFEKELKRQWIPFIILASLLLSKIWMPLSQGQYNDKALLFPDQYLFMNIGPWMIHTTYLIQLAILVVLSGVFLLFYFRRAQNPIKLKPHAQA
ncbi:MAG: hypothetical protein ACJ75B_19110 [Flavisolibacter sp.]